MTRQRTVRWPNSAKIAITFTIALEQWSQGETPIPVQVAKVEDAKARGAKIPQGTKDLHAIDSVEYGGERGVWRLIDILDRTHVPCTALVSGRFAEKFPDAVAELHRRGHEIAAHSYAQDIFPFLDWPQFGIESEIDNIRRSVQILTKITGERPIGWLGSGAAPGENTLRLIASEGFLWCGDSASDDVPYLYRQDGKDLVIIPYQHEINDFNLGLVGKNPPYVYTRCFKDAFDLLYEEGCRNDPKMLSATAHAHVFARPWGALAFEKCIKYAKGYSDVWITRRKDIAKWYLENFG